MNTKELKSKYPLLTSNLMSFDNLEDDRICELERRQCDILKGVVCDFPKIDRYLHSQLHDSWVQSIQYDREQLTVSLNDFSAHCFCDAMVKKFNLKIPHKKRVFPVHLVFDGITTVSLFRRNRNDKMLSCNKDKYIPYLSEFLYDEIARIQKGSISLGLVFWADSKSYQRPRNYLLDINCRDLKIEEYQQQAFIDLCGSQYLDLFISYWQLRERGEMPDYSGCCKLLGLELE